MRTLNYPDSLFDDPEALDDEDFEAGLDDEQLQDSTEEVDLDLSEDVDDTDDITDDGKPVAIAEAA